MKTGNEIPNLGEGRVFTMKRSGEMFPRLSSMDTKVITTANFTIDNCDEYVYKGPGGIATIVVPTGSYFYFRIWQCGTGTLQIVSSDGLPWFYAADNPPSYKKSEDYRVPSEHIEYFWDGTILIGK
jgi:hypothetical protein